MKLEVRNDATETKNVAEDPANAETIKEAKAKILKYRGKDFMKY